MEKAISIKKIIKTIKTSEFFLQAKIPMGYTDGLPILQIKNNSLCLVIPFLKYQTTGKVDKTLVYPIRYTITVTLPDGEITKFETLDYHPKFEQVDFYKPIGLFRHESIQQFDKKQYSEKRNELLSYYDKVANTLIYGFEYTAEDEKKMCDLLRVMIEPSLLPIYKVLDVDFYNKYLRKDDVE